MIELDEARVPHRGWKSRAVWRPQAEKPSEMERNTFAKSKLTGYYVQRIRLTPSPRHHYAGRRWPRELSGKRNATSEACRDCNDFTRRWRTRLKHCALSIKEHQVRGFFLGSLSQDQDTIHLSQAWKISLLKVTLLNYLLHMEKIM